MKRIPLSTKGVRGDVLIDSENEIPNATVNFVVCDLGSLIRVFMELWRISSENLPDHMEEL